MGAIVASHVNVASTSPLFPAQFVSGFQRGLEVAAGIAFAAAFLAVLTVRTSTSTQTQETSPRRARPRPVLPRRQGRRDHVRAA
jgi:hypothetical protein